MKQHNKLAYTRGHVWIYLKADAETDTEDLLKVKNNAQDQTS